MSTAASLAAAERPNGDEISEETMAAPPGDDEAVSVVDGLDRTGVVLPDKAASEKAKTRPIRTRDFGFLPIPEKQRYYPERGFKFTTLLNVAFGIASTFTVANLYYCQPILIELADTFGVTYDRISNVPTLTQAGYATGLLFITPLGDLVRRRELLLILITCSASLSIGLASTHSLSVFEGLSYISGIFTVTPQVMLPFAADLAPQHRRAAAISIVLSGLLLGILIARVLGGLIAEFSSWRNVYWMSVGLQYAILFAMYWILPDWPDKDLGLSYFQILWTMAKFAFTEPVLIQSCMIGMACSAVFSSFWVTLTFLLGGPPYYYSTLGIGLFGLIGILGVCTAPFVGRGVDKLIPWFGTLFGLGGLLVSLTIDTAAGILNIGAVVVTCFLLDVSQQLQQVSNSTRNFAINPAARSRINSVYIIYVFIGQVIGSSVGTLVFVNYGQRASGSLSLGFIGFALFCLLARGPEATTWVGWTGKWQGWKRRKEQANGTEPMPGEEVQEGKATAADEKALEAGEGTKEVPVGKKALDPADGEPPLST